MVQSFLLFDRAQEIDDALERGGGAVGLPLDARENRDSIWASLAVIR